MSNGAASESKLGALHDKLADLFLEALDPQGGCGPQMVNAARAFLKDNDIVCVPVADNRISKLGNKLAAIETRARGGSRTGANGVTYSGAATKSCAIPCTSPFEISNDFNNHDKREQ